MFRTAVLLAFTISALSAQTTAGLRGLIVDPTGAAIPGAGIHIRNTATEAKAGATSSAVGAFEFKGLAPGTYDLTVTPPPGFRPYDAKGIPVGAGEVRNMGRLPLVLGQMRSEIEVTVGAPRYLDTLPAAAPTELSSSPLIGLEIPLCTRFPGNPVMVFGPSGAHMKFSGAQQQEPTGQAPAPPRKQL